jgi:predicted nucleic acid-binding protein
MIFVDSGAIVAKYRQSDDWHRESVECWTKLRRQTPCFTTNLVLAEASRLIRPYIGSAQLARLVSTWFESELLTILRSDQEDDLNAVRLMPKYADQKIGFVDCVSFVLMQKHRIKKVFGFDRHFAVAGFELWPGIGRK